MGVLIPTHEGAILRSKKGWPRTYARTYMAVDTLKATQQGQNRYGGDAEGVHIGATWRI